MILLSHPTGNAFVRHTFQALSEAQLLAEFWTCIAWDENSLAARVLPQGLKQQLARRTFDVADSQLIHTMPWREAARLLAPKLRLQALAKHETGMCSVDAVYRALDAKVAKRLCRVPDLKAVYAYEDGACTTFQQAQSLGIKCIYDLPIGYWKAGHEIYAEEQERAPEWAMTLSGTRDSAAKLERKDQELILAEHVFVASSYTRQTLQLASNIKAKIHVVGYGAPPAMADEPRLSDGKGKLRLIFVGSLGQRKGLSYLLRAVERIGKAVELTLIGKKPDLTCVPLDTALRQHRWIESLPHHEILQEMRRHDVFIFPSLFEGFGLVLLEAMSQGLPVIATAHTAAPDFIEDGRDGFIVPIRSPEAIEEKIVSLLNNRELLQEMKFAAWRKARAITWNDYRAGLKKALDMAIH